MLPLLYILPLIILIEGFASIAIEILTIRQLLPVAGGSVIVTSLIIGVFLLFLALGYERGGRVKDGLQRTLMRNFFIVGVIAGIGLSYTFIEVFFQTIQLKLTGGLLPPLTLYLLFILAPMIYLLGQTLPITMNIAKEVEAAGRLAGRTLGLSTLGSFLGAIFTSLVLMQFLGVAWTIFVVFSLLMLLAISLSRTSSMLLLSVLSIAIGAIIFDLNINNEKLLFRATTNYANYQILDHTNSNLAKHARMLFINDTPSSYHDQTHHGFKYVEFIKEKLFKDLNLQNSRILVLGAGGFTLSTQNNGNNRFTYVEIDRRLHEVVAPDFKRQPSDRLVINDARNYLNSTHEKYDAIVIDVYSDFKAIPAHLLTREFMQNIWEHLADNSYAVFNIIANPTFQDAYSKRIDNTIRSVFLSCTASPIAYKNAATNIIYLCSKHKLTSDNMVYIDNKNNSTIDSFFR